MKFTQQPVAIVTGASSGIGLGLAQALLEGGYRVVANSRSANLSKASAVECILSRRDSTIVARHEVPGSI